MSLHGQRVRPRWSAEPDEGRAEGVQAGESEACRATAAGLWTLHTVLPSAPAAAAEGGVAGTLHVSAGKAGGGLALAAMGATAAAAPLLGLDPWSLINIETAFAIATASSLAGEREALMAVVGVGAAACERFSPNPRAASRCMSNVRQSTTRACFPCHVAPPTPFFFFCRRRPPPPPPLLAQAWAHA